LLLTALLFIFALPASSAPPAKAQPAEVERLIKQLGSDSFTERQAATKALDAIGEPALETLRKAATENGDAEVRRRAKQIVESVEARLYRELRCFKGHGAPVYRLAFSPDGKRALSASDDRTICLWEVETGKELRRFKVHTSVLYGVAFSPDGKQVLSGSIDHTVRLWDLQTGKELRRFEGHNGLVSDVAISPDGKLMLSSGLQDHTMRLWDAQTGKELHRFTGHTNCVTTVVFSLDGIRAVVARGNCHPAGPSSPTSEPGPRRARLVRLRTPSSRASSPANDTPPWPAPGR
jgi:hypothetical protein